MRPFLGAEEFINNIPRWCLWLVGIAPNELRAMPLVLQRVEAVKKVRLASNYACSIGSVDRPTEFERIRQTDQPYLLIPSVSSENRKYIPIGYIQPNVVASNLVFMLPNATLYHFGILTSSMHMAWMRYTCGRLESRYRYSNTIVYNNFPWPDLPSPHPSPRRQGEGADFPSPHAVGRGRSVAEGEGEIELAAQAVLDARAQFMLPLPASGERVGVRGASLADLYDPLTMPPALVKAHQKLDKAVDASYRKAAFANDAQRVEFLFERYQQLTSLLQTEKKVARQKKQKT